MRKPVEIDSDDDGPVSAGRGDRVAKATGMVCTRCPTPQPGRKVTKVWKSRRPPPRSWSWPVT